MKKGICLLLALLMLVAMMGCRTGQEADAGEKDATGKSSASVTENVTEQSAAPTPEPTPAPTPEPTATPAPLPTVEVYGTAKGGIADKFCEGLAWFKDAAGKYGYVDTAGQVVIPAQYSAASNFYKGLAVVSYSDRGAVHDLIIDTKGNTVYRNMDAGTVYIDYERDTFDAEKFPAVEIYKATIRNNKYQGIDEEGFNYLVGDGRLLNREKYMYIGGFVDGIALVGTGTKSNKTMTTVNGSSMDPPYLKYVTFSGNTSADVAKTYYHIRKDGTRVEKDNYDGAGHFSEGLAAVAKYDVKGRLKWGYVDTTGTLVIPMEWDSASKFTDGHAIVSQNGKYGMIDSSGTLTIQLTFDSLWMPSEGLSAAKSGDKWGFVDLSGATVIPMEWDYVGNFSDGQTIVSNKVGEDWAYTVINTTGEQVLADTYAMLTKLGAYYSFVETKGGLRGLMKADGTIVFAPTWEGIMMVGDETMLFKVKQGDKYGLIDWNGVVVREPEFDSIGAAADGVSIVKKGGFWFIMDPKTGEILF